MLKKVAEQMLSYFLLSLDLPKSAWLRPGLRLTLVHSDELGFKLLSNV